MADNASQFVGGIPENYDKGLGPNIFDDYAADLSHRAAALHPTRVLELACGTGIVSRKLKNAFGVDTHLIVTDLNLPMLEVARSKFKTDENIEFATADAMLLNFPDNHFDLVVCQFGVMFFPDKQASFREALRVLRPSGSYLFNTWGEMSENPFSQIAQEVSAQFFSNGPPGFYRVPFSYPDPAVVCADMSRAGFQKIEHETICLQKNVKNWEMFARGLVFGNPLIDEIKEHGNIDPDDVMGAIKQRLHADFGPEPGPMPLKATVFCGRTD